MLMYGVCLCWSTEGLGLALGRLSIHTKERRICSDCLNTGTTKETILTIQTKLSFVDASPPSIVGCVMF